MLCTALNTRLRRNMPELATAEIKAVKKQIIDNFHLRR